MAQTSDDQQQTYNTQMKRLALLIFAVVLFVQSAFSVQISLTANTPYAYAITAGQGITVHNQGASDITLSITGTIDGTGPPVGLGTVVVRAGDANVWKASDLKYLASLQITSNTSVTVNVNPFFERLGADPATVVASPSVYNYTPSALRKWDTALAKVRAGVANAKILCVGDSITYGEGADAINARVLSWPTRLASLINSTVTPALPGLIPMKGGSDTGKDTRLVLGTGWTFASPYGFGKGTFSAGGTVGGTLVVTPGFAFDTADVYYMTNAGLGSGTAQITGGSSPTINCAGTAGIAKTTITGAAVSASNTITFTTSTTGGYYIMAVDCYDSTKKQVLVGNAGSGNSNSTDWASSAGSRSSINAIAAYQPDLVIVSLGINDSRNDTLTALATFRSNIDAVITTARLTGDVIILTEPPPGTGDTQGRATNYPAYRSTLLGLAALRGVPVVDWYEFWGQPSLPSLMADFVHPTATGYFNIAPKVKAVIVPGPRPVPALHLLRKNPAAAQKRAA